MTTPYEDALAAVRATVRESARNCGKSGRKPCADCQKAVTAMTAWPIEDVGLDNYGYIHEMNDYGKGALGNSVVTISHETVVVLVEQAYAAGLEAAAKVCEGEANTREQAIMAGAEHGVRAVFFSEAFRNAASAIRALPGETT